MTSSAITDVLRPCECGCERVFPASELTATCIGCEGRIHTSHADHMRRVFVCDAIALSRTGVDGRFHVLFCDYCAGDDGGDAEELLGFIIRKYNALVDHAHKISRKSLLEALHGNRAPTMHQWIADHAERIVEVDGDDEGSVHAHVFGPSPAASCIGCSGRYRGGHIAGLHRVYVNSDIESSRTDSKGNHYVLFCEECAGEGDGDPADLLDIAIRKYNALVPVADPIDRKKLHDMFLWHNTPKMIQWVEDNTDIIEYSDDDSDHTPPPPHGSPGSSESEDNGGKRANEEPATPHTPPKRSRTGDADQAQGADPVPSDKA